MQKRGARKKAEDDAFIRDVVVSVRPNYAAKILEGAKTVELRRRFPEACTIGALMLIYSSHPVRAIVGHARIREIHRLPLPNLWREFGKLACIEKKDFDDYFCGSNYGSAILLGDVKILPQQVKASELQKKFGFVAPQSFRYLSEEYNSLLRNERLQVSDRHERRNRAGRRQAG
jgi:predicted transcriptional regulator